jgi:regulator of sirC expression with transglutaminase-like and TPR domain
MVGFDKQVEGKKETTLIDLFSGGKFLKPLEAETLVMDSAGMALEDKYLEPAAPKAIILRMLYNLSSWKPEQALGYLDLILAIEPNSGRERFNRALMRARNGDIAGAKTDLEKILDEQPRELDMERVEALYHSL